MICFLTLNLYAINLYSAPKLEKSSGQDEIYDPVPNIMHHIADAHEWHLWGEGDA